MADLSLAPIVPMQTSAENADGITTVICDVRAYFDARENREKYDAGHIPGARHIDLDDDLAGPAGPVVGRHPLPDPESFAASLSKAGIGHDTHVLAYDDVGGMLAGRLVWMLRSLGQNAALLDGGLQAWEGELETSAPEFEPAVCTAREFPAEATVEAEEVEDFIAAGGVVVDVREPDRFRGENETLDSEGGHIDGAINAPFSKNLVAGTFRPISDLASEYVDLDIGEDTIYYCGSGVSACNSMLVAEAAGLGLGRLYVGSWSGYSTRPVE